MKGSEYLYQKFDVKLQMACEMETHQVQVYLQQWFHEEQEGKLCKV